MCLLAIADLLVVISYLDLVGVASIPSEAHSPLIVDANAVLAVPATPQLLKPVSRWDSQIA
jgi:hypothetical protein